VPNGPYRGLAGFLADLAQTPACCGPARNRSTSSTLTSDRLTLPGRARTLPVGAGSSLGPMRSGHNMDSASSSAPLSVTRMLAAGALDAELAALLWLLVGGGVPLLVCGGATEPELSQVMEALLDFAPGTGGPREPAPGWRQGTTLRAGSLREAFDILSRDPFNLSDDQLRSLGVVIVLRDGVVVAAHYVRPVERDRQGHLQHRPPAVLATRDSASGTFEHFSWAVTPELAARIGMRQAHFEDEGAHRARFFSALVDRGAFARDAVRAALRDYLQTHPADTTSTALAAAGHRPGAPP
jgi:hypothetical protein